MTMTWNEQHVKKKTPHRCAAFKGRSSLAMRASFHYRDETHARAGENDISDALRWTSDSTRRTVCREKSLPINAGCRQLETAIWLYFHNGDAVATHTLACNAREIFERQCERRHKPRMFDRISQNHDEVVSKDLWNVMNAARNFFKHLDPKDDVDARIDFNHDDNKMAIYIAAHDCASLLGEEVPVTVKRYLLWLSAIEPELVTGMAGPTGTIPGVHEWTNEKQHEFGRAYVC